MAVKILKFTVNVVTDIRIILAKLTLGVLSLQQNVKPIYEYLRVISGKQVSPLLIPADELRGVLANIMDDFLLIILTIPLTDQFLEMNLYKVYNLPTLHPEFKVEAIYELEGEYLAITKNKLYAALPTGREIRICKGTGGCLCLMNQALFSIDKITVLYIYIYMGDGCKAYSSNLFIPAKSELTSTDSSLVRHNYFQKFNEEYQNITRYSLKKDLGIVKLKPKEIAKIPDRLMALLKLQFKELKRRLVEIKQPLNIHSNISSILVQIGGLILCPIIAYFLWRIYRVHSNIRGFKPMVKIFNDKKDNLFNLGGIVFNRLRTLEAKFCSLIGYTAPDASPRTGPALSSTSARPAPPPRRDSIPMLDINISPQIIQETVKDIERQMSKFQRYQTYLQQQAAEEQE